jgi:tRNA pseudouridine38-40 synthase
MVDARAKSRGPCLVALTASTRSIRATVAYDGTDFNGFQIQSARGQLPPIVGRPIRGGRARTVQGVLERALAQITQEDIRLIGAGRTDSGVHASGQVVALATRWRHSLSDLHRAWNAVLSDDVAVLALSEAQPGFHPRFDATSRTYRYTIWNSTIRSPLLRRTALWVSRPLDLASMNDASTYLVGEHDFATFGSPPNRRRASSAPGSPGGAGARRSASATVRHIVGAAWGQVCTSTPSVCWGTDGTASAGRMLYLDIEANAFLYRMVRSIVGTLLQVGQGDVSVARFEEVLCAADRRQAGPTAPPHGLCLVKVKYGSAEFTQIGSAERGLGSAAKD